MATGQTSPKRGKVIDIPANAPTIGTATDSNADGRVSVPFTAGSTTTGGPIFSYRAVSNPGSIVGTGTSSPITVSGLTNDTAYTFTVAAVNATGTGPFSAASNSATPTIPPGSFESIATFTPTSGGSVTFSSIPSTYKHLQIRYNALLAANNGQLQLRLNSDTGNNYTRQWFTSVMPNSSAAGGDTPSSNIIIQGVYDGTIATYPNVGIIDIHNYSSTTKTKTVRSFSGGNDTSITKGNIELLCGMWNSTSAINEVTLLITNSTYATGSSIALYGIKG